MILHLDGSSHVAQPIISTDFHGTIRLNFIRQLLVNPSKRKQLREINLPSYWKQTCRDPPPAGRMLSPAREWAWTATGIHAGRPGGASPD